MDIWLQGKLAIQVMFITVFIVMMIDLVLAQQDGDLRLLGGTTPRSGRLEIYRNADWVAIYDGGGFGQREAVVACRQLGYGTDTAEVYRGGIFGRGTSSVRLDGVHCVGEEIELMECLYDVCGQYDCSLDRDIGISCGEVEDNRYMPSTTGYRRWSGFVVLLIIVPFFGHAYKRRSGYGNHDSSIIPLPRYHHGRVPLTSALDDVVATSSPGSLQSYSNSPQGLPPEPLAQVFTQGYVYPPTGPTSPAATTTIRSPTGCETPNSSLRPSQYVTYQSPTSPPATTRNGFTSTSANTSPVLPPEYSEYDEDVRLPDVAEEMGNDSTPILGPPPSYEDVVKT